MNDGRRRDDLARLLARAPLVRPAPIELRVRRSGVDGPLALGPLGLAHLSAHGLLELRSRPAGGATPGGAPPDQAAAPPVETQPPPADEGPAEETAWIEVVLVGEDDAPIAGERYRLELPDGRVVEGRTNADGRVRLDGIAGGECALTFVDLDETAWEVRGD